EGRPRAVPLLPSPFSLLCLSLVEELEPDHDRDVVEVRRALAGVDLDPPTVGVDLGAADAIADPGAGLPAAGRQRLRPRQVIPVALVDDLDERAVLRIGQ